MRSILVPLIAALALAGPGVAAAQQAPIGQAHGGRQGAAASPIADAAQSIELARPPERHGLPVPLSLVHGGGAQVLDAGIGWSIPMSYVSRNDGVSRQRPRYLAAMASAAIAPKTTLVLDGQTLALMPVDGAGHYRAIVDNQQIEASEVGQTWRVTDGAGLVYTFEHLSGLGNPTLWFLTSISSGHHAQSKVVLVYRVEQRGDPGQNGFAGPGGLIAPELLLDAVRYDFDATGACAKHELTLGYVSDPSQYQVFVDPPILGMQIDNGRLRVRTQVLSTVDVRARGESCASSLTRLRRYQLGYAADADLGAPRLVKVDVYGREGTPEASVAQPLARYGYGNASRTNVASEPARLVYTQVAPITADRIGRVTGGATTDTLQDFDGDGLPDLVGGGQLRRNLRGQAFAAPVPLLAGVALGVTETWNHLLNYNGARRETVHESTTIQMVDFNADGRTDIIDSAAHNGYWRIYLDEVTGWRMVEVDVGDVIAALEADGHELVNQLPLARAATGQTFKDETCYHWDKNGTLDQSDDHWAPCDASYAPRVRVDGQVTRSEWKLADVNGDGYPDLVASTRPSYNVVPAVLGPEGEVLPPACPPPPPSDPDPVPAIRYCGKTTAFRFMERRADGKWYAVDDNRLRVFLNHAGARIQDGAAVFAAPRDLGSSSTGVEEWVADTIDVPSSSGKLESGYLIYGAVGLRGSHQIAGLVDVNGDGLLDRVTSGQVALGTGTSFVGDFSASYPTMLAAAVSDRYAVCDQPSNVPGTATYTTALTMGYVDLNGDGFPDYLDGNRVRLGTGVGMLPAIDVRAPTDFAISRTVTTCAADTSDTTAGLFDLDGDGRLDYLRVDTPDRTFDVWRLFNETAGAGAIDAGRLTTVANGRGALTTFRYASAKQDARTSHAVPFPEIVVDRATTSVVAGPGTGLEATRYAYGNAALWFDAVADRWTFRGYARSVSVRGVNSTVAGQLVGRAIITNHLQPGDLATSYDRNLEVGRTRQTITLEGQVDADPGAYLDPARNLATDPAWSAQTDLAYGSRRTVLVAFDAGDECSDAAQPQAGFHPPASDGDLDPPCRQVSVVYPRTIDRARGTSSSGTNRVATRTTLESVDSIGRAVAVLDQKDLARSDDDVCVATVFAASIDAWRVLDAPSQVRLLEPIPTSELGPPTCLGATKVLAGEHYTYDGLSEGQVARGLLAMHKVERRDVVTGALYDQWVDQSSVHDAWGNLSYTIADAGGGKTLITTRDQFDGFGLAPARTTQTASDVALPMVTQATRDPVTLVATAVTDANGLVARTAVDGFGRVVRNTFVDPADGVEYAGRLVDYYGQTVVGATGDTIDPAGQRVRVRGFGTRVAAASVNVGATAPTAGETWTTTRLDALGRVRWNERTLGADYAGKVLISDETTYDTLGRPWFVASTYASGAAAPHYGTSYHYRADDTVSCAVVGRGRQETSTTSATAARYSRCSTVQYVNSERHDLVRGPDANDPTVTVSGYDEEVRDASGLVRVRRRRSAAGTSLEQLDLSYDRLAHQTLARRYQTPAGGGSLATWTTTYDSLGRALSITDPATAQRDLIYDHAGNRTSAAWLDGTVWRSIVSQYDGFGRVLHSATRSGATTDDPGSANDYFYDEGSGEAFHQDVAYPRGRLMHAHSATQDVFYGYDSLGDRSFEAIVDSSNRRVERRVGHRPDGAITSVRFALPDTGYALEAAGYRYDSAQRLVGVDWQDETTPTPAAVFTATTIDPLGRYRSVGYGNGVHETFDYRDADRDELLGRTLAATNGSWSATFAHDDQLRTSYRLDASTFTPAGRYEQSRYTFDAADRLATARVQNLSTAAYAVDETYAYDGLGNLTSLVDDAGNLDFTTTAVATDPDRLCRVSGPTWATGTGCNYGYDVLGNVTSAPLGAAATTSRRFSYDGRARVTRIERMSGKAPSGASATYAYDPFGGVSELTVVNSTIDERHDIRFGGAVELSWFKDGGVASTKYERHVPGPFGTLFTKRGFGSAQLRLYTHGDASGTRRVSNGAGAVLQEIETRPFGEERINSGARGTSPFWEHAFDGGDLLPDLQVEQLGARLYEPRVGRFLQRDPLGLVRGAGQSHPYSYAWNDPIDYGDPSGLDPVSTCGWPTGAFPVAGAVVGLGASLLTNALLGEWDHRGWTDGTVSRPSMTGLSGVGVAALAGPPGFTPSTYHMQVEDSLIDQAERALVWETGASADLVLGIGNGLSPVPFQDGPSFGHENFFYGGKAVGSIAGFAVDGSLIVGGGTMAIGGTGCALLTGGICLPVGAPAAAAGAGAATAGGVMMVGHGRNFADSWDHLFEDKGKQSISNGQGGGGGGGGDEVPSESVPDDPPARQPSDRMTERASGADSIDQLDGIEEAQRRARRDGVGDDTIQSTQKSKDNVRHRLDRIKSSTDGDDFE